MFWMLLLSLYHSWLILLLVSLSLLVACGGSCSPVRLHRKSSSYRRTHPWVQSQEGLLCAPTKSQEHGGDTRRPAVIRAELYRTVEEHQTSSRTAICFKKEQEEHCQSKIKWFPAGYWCACFQPNCQRPRGWHAGPMSSSGTGAQCPVTCSSMPAQHLQENTRIGRSAIGAQFPSQMRAGSHWAHNRCERVWRHCGERYAACNILQHDMLASRSVMAWGGKCMSYLTVPWLLLGTRMKSSERLSDLMLVLWDLGSSWCRIMFSLMWPQCVGSYWIKVLMPLTSPHFPLTHIQLSTYGMFCTGASDATKYCNRLSRSSWMAWSRKRRRSPGHYLPTCQEHAQTLSGVHAGTQGPYTLLTLIMSYCDNIHTSWISLWFPFFTVWF